MDKYKKDLKGKKFGKLMVEKYSHSENKKGFWQCKCECGNTVIVKRGNLLNGYTKSCGCIAGNKWKEKENEYLKSIDLKEADIYEISEKLNRDVKTVCSKIYKNYGIDKRCDIIGSKRRAKNRYHLIKKRLKDVHLSKNKNYKNIKLLVSEKDFIDWFIKNDFKGCSVDRIDPKGNYELNNMQLIPLLENITKDRNTKYKKDK